MTGVNDTDDNKMHFILCHVLSYFSSFFIFHFIALFSFTFYVLYPYFVFFMGILDFLLDFTVNNVGL